MTLKRPDYIEYQDDGRTPKAFYCKVTGRTLRSWGEASKPKRIKRNRNIVIHEIPMEMKVHSNFRSVMFKMKDGSEHETITCASAIKLLRKDTDLCDECYQADVDIFEKQGMKPSQIKELRKRKVKSVMKDRNNGS